MKRKVASVICAMSLACLCACSSEKEAVVPEVEDTIVSSQEEEAEPPVTDQEEEELTVADQEEELTVTDQEEEEPEDLNDYEVEAPHVYEEEEEDEAPVEWDLPETVQTGSISVSYSSIVTGKYSTTSDDRLSSVFDESMPNESFMSFYDALSGENIEMASGSGPVYKLSGLDRIMRESQLEAFQSSVTEKLSADALTRFADDKWHVACWTVHDDGQLYVELVSDNKNYANVLTYLTDDNDTFLCTVDTLADEDGSEKYVALLEEGLIDASVIE